MVFEEIIQRLALALAIGFLVGVERGWKQRQEEDETRVAGLRTYTLIGLLGGVSGALAPLTGPSVLAAITMVFGLAWSAFKFKETWVDKDISITGLVAGLLVFALGVYAMFGNMRAAAAGGVTVAAILAFKESLHQWVKTLTWPEIRSALLILAATLIALPLLPNQALDPYGAFNPRDLWLLTDMLAAASFVGYVMLRMFGPRMGLFVGAAAGALASSTAVTVDLARRARAGEISQLAGAAAASGATVVMFARTTVLIGVFAPTVFPLAAPALGAACAGSIVTAIVLVFMAHKKEAQVSITKLTNPLDVKEVLQVALLLSVITIGARIAAHFFGDSGAIAFAATAGIVDIDPVTVSVGAMARNATITVIAASEAILLGAAVNTLSKTVIAATTGGRTFGLAYAATTVAALSAGAAGYWIAFLASAGGLR
jgi:uncharacterized membrane protein (DUF4010 family)